MLRRVSSQIGDQAGHLFGDFKARPADLVTIAEQCSENMNTDGQQTSTTLLVASALTWC
jgi:hypothetical protein